MNRALALIPTVITSKVGRQILLTQKHSPTILFVGGAIGVVATAVTASRATLQLSDTLEEARNDLDLANKLIVSETTKYTEQEFRRDVAVIYARTAGKLIKLYGPSILLGAASIAALTGSYTILYKRNLALTAAYSALDKGFKEYRKRVREEFGEDVDRRFRYAFEEQTVVVEDEYGPRKEVLTRAKKTPNDYSIYARFFDQLCSSWSPIPEYNRLFLQCQQQHANDLLKVRGHIFLNEVYDSLGLERSKAGQVVGWVRNGDGDGFVDFGIFHGERDAIRDFVNGREGAVLLDFNVDGVIYDKI